MSTLLSISGKIDPAVIAIYSEIVNIGAMRITSHQIL